jgi:hypothetical protein
MAKCILQLSQKHNLMNTPQIQEETLSMEELTHRLCSQSDSQSNSQSNSQSDSHHDLLVKIYHKLREQFSVRDPDLHEKLVQHTQKLEAQISALLDAKHKNSHL